MDSDEFDKFIEVDEGTSEDQGESSDEEKENQKPNRQPNTTKEQFGKIYAFVKDHNEGLIDKETYNELWEQLAADLNDIGPPDHTCAEWKKIWCEHKKRKCLSYMSLDVLDPIGYDVGDVEPDTSKEVNFEAKILEKISVLIEKQNVIIEILNKLVQMNKG